VVVLATAAAGCGGNQSGGNTPTSPSTTPTTPSQQVCRSYPSQYSFTVEVTGGGQTQTSSGTGSCSFSTGDSRLRCEVRTSAGLTTTTTSYASIADFVDEGQYLGRLLARSVLNEEPNGNRSTTTYRYDGQRRCTGWDTTSNNGFADASNVTGWDARDRSTTFTKNLTVPGVGTIACSAVFAFDDSARTVSLSITGCTQTRAEVQTFDETFFATRLVVTYFGVSQLTVSSNVTARFQVCK